MHGRRIHQATFQRLTAKKDIGRHIQIVGQVEFLMNQCNPLGEGIFDSMKLNW